MSSSTSSRIERLICHVLVVSFRCSSRLRLLSQQGKPAKTGRTGVKKEFSRRTGVSLSGVSSSRPSSCRRERPLPLPRLATDGRSFSSVSPVRNGSAESAASSSCLVGDDGISVAPGARDIPSESVDGFEFGFLPKNDAVGASSAVVVVKPPR